MKRKNIRNLKIELSLESKTCHKYKTCHKSRYLVAFLFDSINLK